MSAINFFRGPTADIAGIPVADGQIIFDTEKRNIIMDYYSNRLVMGNTVTYRYQTVTPDMWSGNTAVIAIEGASDYNIMLGVPNPTSIENIDAVRRAALSIAGISDNSVTIECLSIPLETLELAFQLTFKVE
jgi:hypothetical protein